MAVVSCLVRGMYSTRMSVLPPGGCVADTGYLLGQEGAVALWEAYDPVFLLLKDTLACSALTLTVSLSTCELTSCL